MQVDLIVKFAGIDLINDTITAVDGSPISTLSPIAFLEAYPDYELLTEFDGTKVITFRQTVAELKTLTTGTPTVIPATEFVGGRPNDR